MENHTDDSCYTLRDAAKYLQDHFKGKADVSKDEVLKYISDHPVFPTRNYKTKIKEKIEMEL